MTAIYIGTGLSVLIGAGAVFVAGWLLLEPLRTDPIEPSTALVAATIGFTMTLAGAIGLWWSITTAALSAEAALGWGLAAGIVLILGAELLVIALGRFDLEAARREV